MGFMLQKCDGDLKRFVELALLRLDVYVFVGSAFHEREQNCRLLKLLRKINVAV